MYKLYVGRSIKSLCWRPDGKVIAVGLEDGTVLLHDVEVSSLTLTSKYSSPIHQSIMELLLSILVIQTPVSPVVLTLIRFSFQCAQYRLRFHFRKQMEILF